MRYAFEMKKYFLFLELILLMGCLKKEKLWFERIIEKDYSIVVKGRYPFTTYPLQDEKVLKYIEKISPHIGVFKNIVFHFYQDKMEGKEFHYKSAGSYKDEIILRYVGEDGDGEVYIGYFLQVVIKKEKVVKIYIDKLPLE
jgi:hypothetical protein